MILLIIALFDLLGANARKTGEDPVPFKKFDAIILALILLGGAGAAAHARELHAKRSAPETRQPLRPFVPVVDHHQHLLSPAGAESKLPAIDLPEALEKFLHETASLHQVILFHLGIKFMQQLFH